MQLVLLLVAMTLIYIFILFFRYGLTVPKKRLDGVMKVANIFGDDSDSENESKKKPVQVLIHSFIVRNHTIVF